MTQSLISLKSIQLNLPHKTCFDNFSANIHLGQRIGIIGRNGIGKSSLLQFIAKIPSRAHGEIIFSHECIVKYVPQLVEEHGKSGGEAFINLISERLRSNPEILLLDEPTNHLDLNNRNYLFRLLDNFHGALLFVSHDEELLEKYAESIWSFEQDTISIYNGSYSKHKKEKDNLNSSLHDYKNRLKADKSKMHEKLMCEQKRAANSRKAGEKSIDNRKWPTITSKSKVRRSEKTSGKKQSVLAKNKELIESKLSKLYVHERIDYKFNLGASNLGTTQLISIQEGAIGYDSIIANRIYLEVGASSRIHVTGKNGCGKTTLIKAILGDNSLIKGGTWQLPKSEDIGYLDQYYASLKPDLSVIAHLEQLKPDWDLATCRNHLNNFLFRKNEEVDTLAMHLSYGEKARLSLAIIAAQGARLLILDEVTNNLDLDAKQQIQDVLYNYPGAIIIVSHDPGFVKNIGVDIAVTI